LLNKKVKVDLYSSSQEGSTIAQRGDNANHEEFYRIGGYTYTSFKNNPNYNTHGKLQNLLNEIANGNK
jgi:hypothetical protein